MTGRFLEELARLEKVVLGHVVWRCAIWKMPSRTDKVMPLLDDAVNSKTIHLQRALVRGSFSNSTAFLDELSMLGKVFGGGSLCSATRRSR
jgi:hypothetical protein